MIPRHSRSTPIAADQIELPLATVLAHQLFPGRAMLLLSEVRDAWRCSLQHVINLIESGDLIAVDIRTSNPVTKEEAGKMKNHKSFRRWLRVPVSAYDAFIRSNSNLEKPL